MATKQHRRNKRNRARSVAGQRKPASCPDYLDEMQYLINAALHAINTLASIQTHTLGGSDD